MNQMGLAQLFCCHGYEDGSSPEGSLDGMLEGSDGGILECLLKGLFEGISNGSVDG